MAVAEPVVTQGQRWDAIVIGAGPAGAVAARELQLQGKRALLIDKSRLPRDKVCGGCLGGTALNVLASIGLGHIPQACGGLPLSSLQLVSGGVKAQIPIGRRIAVPRRIFDQALVHEAMLTGVVVLDQTLGILRLGASDNGRLVTLRQPSTETIVWASVVIIATGLGFNSPGFNAVIFPRSRIGLGAISKRAPVKVDPGTLHMAIESDGYVGVTASGRDRFEIAAAINPHALAAAKSAGQLVHQLLNRSGLRPTIDLETLKWRGTQALTRRTTPLASYRCLVIGDAAGYAEPFTGEGIGWAMHSALLATSLLGGPLQCWDDAIGFRWRRLFDDHLAGRQWKCRALTQILSAKQMRQIIIQGLRRAPSLSQPIVRMLDRPVVIPSS
jgi:menaquinone-9 beta-reductase